VSGTAKTPLVFFFPHQPPNSIIFGFGVKITSIMVYQGQTKGSSVHHKAGSCFPFDKFYAFTGGTPDLWFVTEPIRDSITTLTSKSIGTTKHK
jgi:hypothetical protein